MVHPGYVCHSRTGEQEYSFSFANKAFLWHDLIMKEEIPTLWNAR